MYFGTAQNFKISIFHKISPLPTEKIF